MNRAMAYPAPVIIAMPRPIMFVVVQVRQTLQQAGTTGAKSAVRAVTGANLTEARSSTLGGYAEAGRAHFLTTRAKRPNPGVRQLFVYFGIQRRLKISTRSVSGGSEANDAKPDECGPGSRPRR